MDMILTNIQDFDKIYIQLKKDPHTVIAGDYNLKNFDSYFMKFSKNAMRTIYISFGISLLYNIVGLSYAVTGNLLPIVAAIIMPLSTITIVSFVTIMSNIYSLKKY